MTEITFRFVIELSEETMQFIEELVYGNTKEEEDNDIEDED